MFLPEDSGALLESCMAMIDLPSRNKDLLVESMGKCMKGDIDKRLIRALVAGSMSATETKRIISKEVTSIVENEVVQGKQLMREETYEERVSRVTSMPEKFVAEGFGAVYNEQKTIGRSSVTMALYHY